MSILYTFSQKTDNTETKNFQYFKILKEKNRIKNLKKLRK